MHHLRAGKPANTDELINDDFGHFRAVLFPIAITSLAWNLDDEGSFSFGRHPFAAVSRLVNPGKWKLFVRKINRCICSDRRFVDQDYDQKQVTVMKAFCDFQDLGGWWRIHHLEKEGE